MRNKKFGVVFRQSLYDFPCPVTLGENTPSFGLHRYKQSLRFVPSGDEGFTLRGDKRRLVYKGRRRSHRFTILGDSAFEYDCILEREPDTNVIYLLMEGAGQFDFFRQPDFLKDPLLAGSYAVYKKQTLAGEGTGKLCHIHRPEIIDARGRRCWGDLSISGNQLCISIPENWLSEAKYPVIVDPTIGTATVGSQYKWDADPPHPLVPLAFELAVPVNRFLVSETINGLCTAYIYTNADDGDAGGRAVLYSDNGNEPRTRKSTQEGFIDLRVNGGKPAGWRNASFTSDGSIAGGSNIWFGVFCEYMWLPRFDFGTKCYVDMWDEYESIPNTYPLNEYNYYENFRLSMYFTYSGVQNYVRTLTQGVSLIDTSKTAVSYKRPIPETASVTTVLSRVVSIIHTITETLSVSRITRRWGTFTLVITDEAGNTGETIRKGTYYRKQQETIGPVGRCIRSLFFTLRIGTTAFVRDYLLRRFLKAKTELEIKSCICRELFVESRIR